MANDEANISQWLQGCRNGDRGSQRKLYEQFYGYAMSISLRYTGAREEAVEVLNDAFLKVFAKIDAYDPAFPFRAWLRRIVINTAIDHHRKTKHLPTHQDISAAYDVADEECPLPEILPHEDLLPILQKLSPAYRTVFNLYVIEEYKHEEIATLLGISVGTSRSNLMRAVQQLRTWMRSNNYHPSNLN